MDGLNRVGMVAGSKGHLRSFPNLPRRQWGTEKSREAKTGEWTWVALKVADLAQRFHFTIYFVCDLQQAIIHR